MVTVYRNPVHDAVRAHLWSMFIRNQVHNAVGAWSMVTVYRNPVHDAVRA